jgi:hypothetical protein
VKQHRGDRNQKQYERYSHPLCILATKGCGYELKGDANAIAMADFIRHRDASCFAHSTGRDAERNLRPQV